MRATWEYDADSREVCSGTHECVATAVRGWTLPDDNLTITLHDRAADELGFPATMNLRLGASDISWDGHVKHQVGLDILLDQGPSLRLNFAVLGSWDELNDKVGRRCSSSSPVPC